MKARLALAGALAALGVWAGCTAFDDAILPAQEQVTGTSTTSSSSASSSSSGAAGCKRHLPAERGTGAPAGGDIEIVVVVREIHFGIDDKANPRQDFGYDLDGVCSCAEDKGSCAPRAGAPDGGICDGDEGRDDALGRMISRLIKLGVTDPSTFANASFATGERSILFRIQSYNGAPNDDDIRFSIYRSRVAQKPPAFTADEKWDVNKDDIVTGAAGDPFEPISFSGGFVRDGELVVNDLTSSKIPFNGDSDLLLKQVKFTGTLKQVAGTWNLENVLGTGRWPLEDALRTVARVRDPLNDNKTRFCENEFLMVQARSVICSSADIAVALEDDRQTPPRPCSAISSAVSFVTVPAALGGTYPTVADTSCQGKDIGTCN